MNVNSTTYADPASTGAAADAANTRTAGALGKDAFLQLLVTQLQHQDPMKPQADGEFIAQLAQFSSLEQLTDISTSLDELKAFLETPASVNQ